MCALFTSDQLANLYSIFTSESVFRVHSTLFGVERFYETPTEKSCVYLHISSDDTVYYTCMLDSAQTVMCLCVSGSDGHFRHARPLVYHKSNLHILPGYLVYLAVRQTSSGLNAIKMCHFKIGIFLNFNMKTYWTRIKILILHKLKGHWNTILACVVQELSYTVNNSDVWTDFFILSLSFLIYFIFLFSPVL